MRAAISIVLATVALTGTSVAAQEPAHAAMAEATACGSYPTPAPAAFIGWATPTPLRDGTLSAGQSVRVPLTRDMRFAITSSTGVKPGQFGAALTLSVTAEGVYDIALSQGAWLDLVRDGAALRSTAHRHAAACSTLRKVVTCRLQPGRYTLQLSGTTAPELVVEAVKVG